MRWRLNRSALDAVVAHAREAAPAECCGLLIGGRREVVEAFRSRNAADRPTRFLIEPQDHFAAIRSARSRGLEIVGFYHSHPHSPAVPSATDVSEANYPDYVSLIVGLRSEPPDARLFRYDGRNFHEEPFVTTGE